MREQPSNSFIERLELRQEKAGFLGESFRKLHTIQRHERIATILGNTPLRRIPLENDNLLIQKDETRNPTESHYDRCYGPLLRQLFIEGKIKPGSRLFETSSGSAGISFSWMCKLLGYQSHVYMPAFVPKPRIDITRTLADQLWLSKDRESYLRACAKKMHKDFRALEGQESLKRNPPYMPNHSQDPRVPSYFSPIADELTRQNHQAIDYFIGGIGNGSTLLGVGQQMKHYWPDIKVIGFEPTAACPYYHSHRDNWGGLIRIGDDSEIPEKWHYHQTPGLGSFGNIHFPFVEKAIQDGVVDDICHVPDHEVLPRLAYNEGQPEHAQFGSSTLLARFIAEEMAKQVRGKVFFTLAYDRADRY